MHVFRMDIRNGCILSAVRLRTADRGQMHYASAKEGTYSIKAKKNANPHGLMKAYLRSAPRMQDAMREIALEMARKKYTSKKAYEKANRKAQLEVIHNWYQRNVKRYGFEYNFYPREDA